MPAIYVTEQGAKLGMDHRRLEVRKDDAVVAEFPMGHVDRVVILGNVGITTPALRRLMARGVDLVFMSLNGRYYGRLSGETTPHVALRRAQYAAQGDGAFTLALAQRIVAAKIHNEKVFIRRRRRVLAEHQREDELDAIVQDLDRAEARAGRTQTLNALRGVEGSATARYFGGYRALFGPRWRFDRRNRRPPLDPINVMLSLGYTLLTRAAESAVQAVGLDPYVGFLHADVYNRPSLALDLVETCRVIVDDLVRGLVTDGTVAPGDFRPGEPDERPVVMERAAVQRFIGAYEARMRQARVHPRTGQRMARWRFLELQAREIARVVQAGAPDRYRALRFR
jgi:CRISPR-associated protein Cas1